jgi:hypothetical protein
MLVNLGALFAAGVTPQQLGDMTWKQVGLVSQGIQLYHLDLATRIMTGKSAVAETSGAPTQHADRSWMHKKPEEVSPEEAKKIAQAELDELARFAAGPAASFGGLGGLGGIAVKVTGQ